MLGDRAQSQCKYVSFSVFDALHSISVRTVNVAVEGIMVSSLCLNKQHNQSYRANKNKNRQNYKTWKLQKYKKTLKLLKRMN